MKGVFSEPQNTEKIGVRPKILVLALPQNGHNLHVVFTNLFWPWVALANVLGGVFFGVIFLHADFVCLDGRC